jgi:hypothetical protein
MRVWRHKNTAYSPRNIQPTVPYGWGSVMVWGCISHDCKLDLVGIQGVYDGLTCPKYALWDSNPGLLLAKEQKSRLPFGGRRLVPLNDAGWGMRRRVEVVIQALGGYTRYWSLNNRCRQVIHKWRFIYTKKKVKHPNVFLKWQMIQVSRDYWPDNLKNAKVTC